VVALGRIEAQHRMIEDIECFHAELSIHTLRQLDVFQQRQIGEKLIGSGECISSDVAKMCDSWTAEGGGTGPENRYRREKGKAAVAYLGRFAANLFPRPKGSSYSVLIRKTCRRLLSSTP